MYKRSLGLRVDDRQHFTAENQSVQTTRRRVPYSVVEREPTPAQREPWYYYAGVATLGLVIGAYLMFRMARKAGLDYLNRKFGQRKVARLLKYFERWGTGALIFSTVVPFPFPTSAFFAIAGVLDYPLRTFIVVVALGRAARYGAIAAIASHYGPPFRCRAPTSRATSRVVARDCRNSGRCHHRRANA